LNLRKFRMIRMTRAAPGVNGNRMHGAAGVERLHGGSPPMGADPMWDGMLEAAFEIA
jgi:hypothetical protein